MDQKPVYYQAPEHHDLHIRKMVLWLSIFFASLFTLVLVFIIFAKELAVHLPFSAEKRFVKPYEVMADKWLSDTLGDPDVETYLQDLANDLSKKMDLADDIVISVHYIDNDVENAFATLGGHIFIFSGIMNTVEDENALAMIIAHEIAHIKNRDPVVAMGRGAAIQMMYTFVTGDSLADVGGELGMLFFSREQEEIADIDALHTLNKHYGHVRGYDTFFTKLLEKGSYDGDMPVWLSSHPELSSRVDKLNEVIEENDFALGEATALPEYVIELTRREAEPDSLQQLLTQ